jgi:hypothetical protein
MVKRFTIETVFETTIARTSALDDPAAIRHPWD